MEDSWQQDYQREVEEVLSVLRTEKKSGAPAPMDLSEAVIPSAPTVRELRLAQEKLAGIEPVVIDLREKLDRRSQQLEEELRRRDRQNEVVFKLNADIRRLELEAEESRRSHDERRAAVENLAEKTRSGLKANEELKSALEESRLQALEAAGAIERLKNQVLELEALSVEKDQAIRQAQIRQELIARNFTDQSLERENKALALARALEDTKLDSQALEERLKLQELRLARAGEQNTGLLFELAEARCALEKANQDRDAVHRLELERQDLAARLQAAESKAKEADQGVAAAAERSEKAFSEARQFQAEANARLILEMKALEAERHEFREQTRSALAASEEARRQTLAEALAIRRDADLAVEKTRAAELSAAARRDEEQKALLALRRKWEDEAGSALEQAKSMVKNGAARETELAERAAALEKELHAAFIAGERRLAEAVREALDNAERMRAAASSVASEVKKQQALWLDQFEHEKALFRSGLETERESLLAAVEAERRRLASEHQEALAADRRRLEHAAIEEALSARELERCRAEAERTRETIAEEIKKWNIKES